MKKEELSGIAERFGTPVYVYDARRILEKCKELKTHLRGARLLYACKANDNVEIIRLIYRQGFDIETVSPGEISIARKAGVPVSRITFTCGSIDDKEIRSVAKLGVTIHLDSLRQVEIWGKSFPGSEISVRLNLNVGAGSHSHIITGGPNSKFGVDVVNIKELKTLAVKYKLKIAGLHQHIGSNILDLNTFLKGVKVLFEAAMQFPDLKHLGFGGGFGVPYRPGEKDIDLKKLSLEFQKLNSAFNKKYKRRVKTSFEPGRYIVAQSGYLLVKVTDVKRNTARIFVGVNSGLNHFIRPAMYGAYHEIINLSNPSGKKEKVTVAGYICESGDVFAKDRMIAKPRIGDILAICDTGAYGYAMASNYNSRPKPKEFLMLGRKIKRI